MKIIKQKKVRFYHIFALVAFSIVFMHTFKSKAQAVLWQNVSGTLDIANVNNGNTLIGAFAPANITTPSLFTLGTTTKPVKHFIYSSSGTTTSAGGFTNTPGLSLQGVGTYSASSFSMGVHADPWIGAAGGVTPPPIAGSESKLRITSLLKVQPYSDNTNLLDVMSSSGTTYFHIDKTTSSFANNVVLNGGLRIGSSTSGGYVLTALSDGTASWMAPGTVATGTFSYNGNDIYNNNIGNVGIGKVPGNAKLDVGGTAAMTGFKLSTLPQEGYVLTSDVSGIGNWRLPANSYWSFANNDLSSINSGNVGIGKAPGALIKLDVNGTAAMTALKVGTTSTQGYVLTALDAFGNVGWKGLTSQWGNTGNDLYYNTGAVAIGLPAPIVGTKLHVNGPVVIGDNTIQIKSSGGVPLGYNLFVQNGILTEKIKVAVCTTAAWSDFVFDKEYKLAPLKEVSAFIAKNHHLPEIPSAQEVVDKGINLGEMDAKLLMKIEELTLHLIKMNETVEKLTVKVQKLEAENNTLTGQAGK